MICRHIRIGTYDLIRDFITLGGAPCEGDGVCLAKQVPWLRRALPVLHLVQIFRPIRQTGIHGMNDW